MVTVGIFPFKENSHGRAGNRSRDLMISSQRLWPLDHKSGHTEKVTVHNNLIHQGQLVLLAQHFSLQTEKIDSQGK